MDLCTIQVKMLLLDCQIDRNRVICDPYNATVAMKFLKKCNIRVSKSWVFVFRINDIFEEFGQ